MTYADPEVQRAYSNRYNKIRSQRERVRLMAILGGKCVVCGTADNLEFHHKDPDAKEFTIGNALRYSKERRTQEAMKCEIRCTPHHLEAHAPQHGTESKFRSGCRCEECIEGKRIYNRDWMKKWRDEGRDKSRANYSGLAQGCNRSLQD